MTRGWSQSGRRSSGLGSRCFCTRTTAPRWTSCMGSGTRCRWRSGSRSRRRSPWRGSPLAASSIAIPTSGSSPRTGGGTLPYLAGRLDAGWRSDPRLAARAPEPPSGVLGRLFLDAVLYHPRALQAAADLVGTEHLALGTDHPFSIVDPVANLAAIDEAFDGVGRRSGAGGHQRWSCSGWELALRIRG